LGLAKTLRDQGNATEALAYYARAQVVLEGVLRKVPDLDYAKEYLQQTRVGRAYTLARMGKDREATDEARELAKQVLIGSLSYELAAVYALAADHVRDDMTIPAPQRRRLENDWVEQALGVLKRARDGGFVASLRTVEELQTARVVDALRGRPEFQEFLKALKPGKPGT
jgi:hypothetical protein